MGRTSNIKFNPNRDTKRLFELMNLDIKGIKLFNRYLLSYEQSQNYKKVLSTLVDFEQMYPPLERGVKTIDLFNRLASINEARQIKRVEISMLKKEILTTTDEHGEKRLVITNKGHKIYYKEYPLTKLREEKWDGFWTLVTYDIPELLRSDRRYIRNKLLKLGFGNPHKSNYVTPLNIHKEIKELIDNKNYKEYAWVLRAKRILGLSNKEIAKRAWPLSDLNYMYSKLFKMVDDIKDDPSLLELWKHYFRATRHNDPLLPFELLPNDWQGEKCYKTYQYHLRKLFPNLFKRLFVPKKDKRVRKRS